MSNIITSYLRIRKTDGTHLNENERERLFKGMVNWHGDFGTYYVRVVKRYREKEKSLDIQFGSGKWLWEDPSNFVDDHREVEMITRSSNEGWFDMIQIERYQGGKKNSTKEKMCTYAFDRIFIISDTNWLKDHGLGQIELTAYALNVSGTYHSANYRGFVDWEDSNAPVYDEDYPYDYFVLTPTEELKFTAPAFMADLSASDFAGMPNGTKMILYYQFRKVAVITKNYDNVEKSTADYWDNCVDLKIWEASAEGFIP